MVGIRYFSHVVVCSARCWGQYRGLERNNHAAARRNAQIVPCNGRTACGTAIGDVGNRAVTVWYNVFHIHIRGIVRAGVEHCDRKCYHIAHIRRRIAHHFGQTQIRYLRQHGLVIRVIVTVGVYAAVVRVVVDITNQTIIIRIRAIVWCGVWVILI